MYHECLLSNRLECDRPSIAKGVHCWLFARRKRQSISIVSPSAKIATWRYWFGLSHDVYVGNMYMHNVMYHECLLSNKLECDRPSIAKG